MTTWFQDQRIGWIKESIEIFGAVNRGHIQAKFGISTPQASADLKKTMQRWPDLMIYDAALKSYVRITGGALAKAEGTRG